MPDILTHLLLAEKVHEYLHGQGEAGDSIAQAAAAAISSRPDLFRFGSQGPDIFFYHNFWPWRRKKSLSKLGNRLHVEKTGTFFIESFNYLKTKKEEAGKGKTKDNDFQAIFAYLCGCICHFVLDRNAHPYIYRLAGFTFEHGDEKGHNSYRHQKLEAAIDCLLWKKNRYKEAYLEPVHLSLKLSQDFPASMDKYYRQIIYTLYGLELAENSLSKACRDMNLGARLIYDPNNVKKKFFDLLGKISGKEVRLPRPLYPVSLDCNTDYLNEGRRQWSHPLAEEEVSISSFLDIFEESKVEAADLILKAVAFLDGTVQSLDSIFKDYSYLTNKEWGTETAWRNAEGEGILEKLTKIKTC